ncbi:hypothetical protein [Candidatus Cardinium hertigii]|uniref:DUF481 domain-containing protein n=1 Tax=Candidatus Cardinium hertigii TaxID=247481 RepID=A0A3N2QBL6_9BACT|nr:hypothetical protein [Candidatus Cardinium hertigii]ROT47204.1 hypothetical protein EDM02_03535 [Candidatus Cardinium hertigii]
MEEKDKGHRLLIHINYALDRRTQYMLQFVHRTVRDHNMHQNIIEENTTKISKANQNKFKLHASYKITNTWKTNIAIQYTNCMLLGHTNHGYSLSSTQQWKRQENLQFDLQIHYFQTENFITRLYFYEPNSMFSDNKFKSYYGTGMAFMGSARWKLLHWMSWNIQYKLKHLFRRVIRMEEVEKRIMPLRTVHSIGIQWIVRF